MLIKYKILLNVQKKSKKFNLKFTLSIWHLIFILYYYNYFSEWNSLKHVPGQSEMTHSLR